MMSFFKKIFSSKNQLTHKYIEHDALEWLLDNFFFFEKQNRNQDLSLFKLSDVFEKQDNETDIDFINRVTFKIAKKMNVSINDNDNIQIVDNLLFLKNEDIALVDYDFNLAYVDFNTKDKSFVLSVEKSIIKNPSLLFSVLAHELAHVHLGRLSEPIFEDSAADLLIGVFGYCVLGLQNKTAIINYKDVVTDLSIGYLLADEWILIIVLHNLYIEPLDIEIENEWIDKYNYSKNFILENYDYLRLDPPATSNE